MCLDCFKKKEKLNFEIYYCFECKIYFKDLKKYNKHMRKRH